MLQNYFRIAFRNLVRGGIYSLINIVGLAIGITCALLITLYVQYEYSYDEHFADVNRLYRVTTTLGSYRTKDAPLPLFSVLKERFPEVENSTRLFWMEPPYPYFSPVDDQFFQEAEAYYADSSVFDVLGVDVIHGRAKSALTEVQTVALSVSTAKRYFGTDNVLNRTIRFNNHLDLKITAIYNDFPHNSHIHPALLVSAVTSKLMMDNSTQNWEWLYSSSTYIRLRPDANIAEVNNALSTLFFDVTGFTREQYNADFKMELQPVSTIHLHSHYPGENNGSVAEIYAIGIIGIVIIVIAVINFINLSTARSLRRAREVGMRKVLGSQRRNLVAQFLMESALTVLLSGILSCLMVLLSINMFNEIINAKLSVSEFFNFKNVVVFIAFIVSVGIVSGLYPAFFLSGHNAVHILKGKFSSTVGSVRFRKALVITQFMIGFIALAGTIIINLQLNFMIHKDLGYSREHVVTIELPNDSIGVDRLRDQIKQIPHVVTASMMSESFNNVQGWYVPWYEGAPPERDFSVTRFHTDHNFKELANLELVSGRFFNEDFRGDSLSYILNETAIKRLGWKIENAVGKSFGSEKNPGRVIGVVRDFNFRHLALPITPFVFYPPSQRRNVFERGKIAVRVEMGYDKPALSAIEKTWNTLVPEWPFRYSYLDTDLDHQYLSEVRLNRLTELFSALAIIVSAFGLLALASFNLSQRIREIGIRKVLGANTRHIIYITSRDFIILVCLGIVSGIPISYLAMTNWLDGYVYRIGLSWYPFAVAFSISFMVALVTVVAVSWRASWSNPVKSLRQD